MGKNICSGKHWCLSYVFLSQSKYSDFHFLHLFILYHLVAKPHISQAYAVQKMRYEVRLRKM
jgi:hypothetical protein